MRDTSEDVRHLLHLLTELDRACSSLLDSQVGLTHDEVRTILELGVSQEPLRPGDLARRLRLQPSAVSRMLRNLESHGCIERLRAPDDARSHEVHLTDKGSRAARRVSDRLADYFGGLSQRARLGSIDDFASVLAEVVEYTLMFRRD